MSGQCAALLDTTANSQVIHSESFGCAQDKLREGEEPQSLAGDSQTGTTENCGRGYDVAGLRPMHDGVGLRPGQYEVTSSLRFGSADSAFTSFRVTTRGAVTESGSAGPTLAFKPAFLTCSVGLAWHVYVVVVSVLLGLTKYGFGGFLNMFRRWQEKEREQLNVASELLYMPSGRFTCHLEQPERLWFMDLHVRSDHWTWQKPEYC